MTDLEKWIDNLIFSLGDTTYSLMQWIDSYWWPSWAGLILAGMLIGMSPIKVHYEHKFHEYSLVYIRKTLLVVAALLLIFPFVIYLLYLATAEYEIKYSHESYTRWFKGLLGQWYWLLPALFLGSLYRFIRSRYFDRLKSILKKKIRLNVTSDKPTDIREEATKYIAKDFRPDKYYKDTHLFLALDENDKPIYVPYNTWYETNMQVIGPTRYGKGVIMGNIMEQAILKGDCLFYIDPKKDKFGPRIMQQACKKAGRKFYYLALHDEGYGRWAPFAGGKEDDGLTRLEKAFGLEFTGDPGTDYYKSQERKDLVKAFSESRYLDALFNKMEENTESRINSELTRWRKVESLRVTSKNKGFSIERALKEGAVVYIQGSLNNDVVKKATNVFIIELIQEAMRLEKERKTHLTAIIDEVSFLVSKELAQALATAVGFRVNFVLAYQSQNDLLNIDDKNVNAKYVHNSINVNSQIKAVYGGADFATADWLAELSGTINKEVTKMERTEFSATGGEQWQDQRTIGSEKENYINSNKILTLPPRVCVFIQPRNLAQIAFSSFVPVEDMEALDKYLEHQTKKQKAGAKQSKKENTATPVEDASEKKRPANQFAADQSKKKQDESTTNKAAKKDKKKVSITSGGNNANKNFKLTTGPVLETNNKESNQPAPSRSPNQFIADQSKKKEKEAKDGGKASNKASETSKGKKNTSTPRKDEKPLEDAKSASSKPNQTGTIDDDLIIFDGLEGMDDMVDG